MKFKHPLIRAALATLWYSVAALVVLAAILVSMARLLLPLVEDYKSEAEQLVSSYAGQTIRISGLRAEWTGLGPQIHLKDVRLYDEDGKKVRLQFSEARIGIDIFASIQKQDVVPSSLTISGVQLSFTRHIDGSVSVRGLSDRDDKTENREEYSRLISAWLFRQPEIGVESSSIYWSDEKSGVKDLFFTDVYLRLRNDASRHQIEASLILPEHLGDAFAFAIDLQGDMLDPLGWVGELYIKGRGFVLPEWWPRDIVEKIGIAKGLANFELWGTWKNGRAQKIEGTIDAQALSFSGARGKQLPLTALLSDFSWSRLKKGWNVQLSRFTPSVNQQAWPASQASLTAYTDEDRYELAAGFVRVGDVLSTVALFDVLDKKRHAPLFGLQPQADLSNLVAHYSGTGAEGQRLQIESDFTALSTTPWRELPAAIDLSGHLSADLDKGHLKIDSRNAQLNYPAMFRDKLALSRLQGDLYWKRSDGSWQIDAPGLSASNDDIKLDVRLSMLLPEQGAPYLDLVGYFRDGHGKQTSKYLPVAVLPVDAVSWLDQAIVDGHVPNGGLVVHGPLDKFPFDHGEGKFEVRFDVKNGVLDYRTGWPRLEDVDAEVVFSGRGMQINGRHARILDSTVKNLQVEFADMTVDIPDLGIHGLMDVKTADVLEYVVRSELGKDYAKTLKRLKASGTGELELALGLSLGLGKDHLSGRMRFDNNTIALRDQDISLKSLNGRISVVDGQFRGEKLQAQLLGAPVTIRVEPGKQDDIALNIEARTRLDLNASLRKNLGKSIPDIMPGKADWLLNIHIPDAVKGKKEEAKFVLSSDLRGVSIAAPAPLGKTTKQERPLSILIGIGELEKYHLTVDYNHALQALLELGPDFSLQRGELALGKSGSGLPDKPGLLVSGRLEKLAIDEWRNYAKGLGLLNSNDKTSPPSADWISSVQLELDELQAFDMLFKQVNLDAVREEQRWKLDVRSDRLAGHVVLHDELRVKPVQLDLDYLKLQSEKTDGVEAVYDPHDFPGLELKVAKLFFDSTELGKLSATITPSADGLFMERMELQGEHFSMNASGEWAATNEKQSTRLQAKLKSDDFSKMLTALDYESAVVAGRSKGDAQIQWSGSPMQYSVNKLNGSLSLDIHDGQLLDVNPGAGRVFGLLSLQTLPRRLTLDFSDVFKKGFSFDRIKGSFLLERGDAYTTNLTLEGPVAQIDISGRTGLAAKDYDQLVTVTPHLTASLPLAGALVGGPLAGGVLYAIDKLFKPAIDKISQVQYAITGSWSEPKIVKLGAVGATTEETKP